MLPIPEADFFDALTIKVLTLFLFLILDVGCLFLRVVCKVAPLSSDPSPKICKVSKLAEKLSLSALKISYVPSDLTKVYLSSSNGKNVSLVPADTVDESSPFTISTLSCFLIVIDDVDKSTDSTTGFGNRV